MTDNKQKILICGDIRGSYKQFFTKIDSTNKKAGPFDLVLCAGSFFSDSNNDELEAFKNGFKQVSCPTYILGPCSEASHAYFESLSMSDDEICTNLSYLGKRGLYTTSSGLKIAYLSGIEATDENNAAPWNFTKKDVVAVRDSCLSSKSGEYRGVDVLITSQEPKLPETEGGSMLISWLALQIKPRYHFCSMSDAYNERPPYRTPRDGTTQIDLSTRLITLAAITNKTKAKYLYAANVQPVEKMRVIDLLQKTTDETECPYLKLKFTVEPTPSGVNRNQEDNQFFYDMNYEASERKRGHGNHHNHHQKRPRQTFDQEKCWFCLSSPDVEKHLVITVGENFYMAMPKGPINENHVLLLSINHIQSSALLSNESWEELLKFKDALKKFYASIGQVVCFFERNYRTSHLLIDCIPVKKELEWQIKLTVDDKADEYNLQMETVPNLMDPTDLPDKGPYFSIEMPEDSVMITRQMKNFPIQLTREIMCAETLLNDEAKIDWRQCKLTRDEEMDYVKKFRVKYGHFDFNLEGIKD